MLRGKIFIGGKIITMNEACPTCEAVYVENGRVVVVDSFENLEIAYKEAQIIDLGGKVMMPGFIEPHGHFDLCSIISKMHNVSGIDFVTTENVVNQLKETVAKTPKGRWVMCFRLDFLLNRDLPDVIKDENGEPLDILTEQGFIVPAVFKWLAEIEDKPFEMLVDEAKLWSGAGVTATWVAGYTPLYLDHIKLMTNFFNSKGCPIRGDYSITFNSIDDGSVDIEQMTVNNTDKSKMTGIKSWYDGSPYTGNMLMYDNYLENDTMQNKLYVPSNHHGRITDIVWNIVHFYVRMILVLLNLTSWRTL